MEYTAKKQEISTASVIVYIAANKYTPAFDKVTAETAKKAIYKIKRRNKEWRDCTIWVESGADKTTIHDGGL